MSQDDKKQARFALWVLFGINMMNFFDRQIPAAVTEPIRKEFLLTDTHLGWLATAFTLIYACAGVPLGRLADRGARTKVLAVGVTVWSALTAASGLAWNYWSLFAARLGVGIGEASCAPAGNALIGDFYPAHRRARAISIFMLGLPIGIFLSNLLSGRIAQAYTWRAPFFVAFFGVLVPLTGVIAQSMRLRVDHGATSSAQSRLLRVALLPGLAAADRRGDPGGPPVRDRLTGPVRPRARSGAAHDGARRAGAPSCGPARGGKLGDTSEASRRPLRIDDRAGARARGRDRRARRDRVDPPGACEHA